MAASPLLARWGLRVGLAGSSVSLALALGTAVDAAARIGAYVDTTAGAEVLGFVVGGVSGPTLTRSGSSVNVVIPGSLTAGGAAQSFVGLATSLSPVAQAHAVDGTAAVAAARWSANATGAYLFLAKSRGAAVGTHGVVSNGDTIGILNWNASDGTQFREAARIRAEVDGATISSTSMPGRLVFQVTPSGSVTPTTALTISSTATISATGPLNLTKANGQALVVDSTEASTSTITGCAKFAGGVGIDGAINTNGNFTTYGGGNIRSIGFDMFAASKWNFAIDGSADADKLLVRLGSTTHGTWTAGGLTVTRAASVALWVETSNSGSTRALYFTDTAGNKRNWLVGAQNNLDQGFEITPSTSNGGSTYSTPALSIAAASGAVTLGSTLTILGDTFNVNNRAALYADAANTVYYAGSSGMLFASSSGASVWLTLTSSRVDILSGIALRLGNAAVAETPTPTHTITIQDSTGTTYRVPCVA
jgi:hypothetical protein